MTLHNKLSKEALKKILVAEDFKRITFSFYKYVMLEDADQLRDQFYASWTELGALSRIYLAHEGINAQMSVPEKNYPAFLAGLYADPRFDQVPIKIAVEDDGKSFYKLIVRVKKKIVADGLDENTFDVTNVGKHLDAQAFNEAISDPDTILVDMRNHYESEVGRFENAICPDADTFKEELPMVRDLLSNQQDKKIVLYCTGGIRCEKASAYLKHYGYKDVNQLYGGIIAYARQVKEQGLESKFKGKNFVFDERVGERISDDIISTCHQCDTPCDTHVNCANDDCHLLFIQCESCAEKQKGCCSVECQEINALPVEEQRKIRKGRKKEDCLAVYKSRLRPNLKKLRSDLKE
jgi:UPF0176 protein